MGSSAARATVAAGTALVLVPLLLIAANLRTALTPVGPLLGNIQTDAHLSGLAASALISLPLLGFAALSPVAPVLARRLGVEWALAWGLIGLAVGILLRSVPGVWCLWIGTALLGAAIALLNVLLPTLVKRDFPNRINQVTGVYATVQSIFAALAAGVAVPIGNWSNWNISLGSWALLAIIALATLVPLLRRTRQAGATVPPKPSVAQSGEAQTTAVASTRSLWRSAAAWQIAIFMSLQSVGYYTIITWMPSVETSHGISVAMSGVNLMVFNLAGLIGNLAYTVLAARVHNTRVFAVGSPALTALALLGHLLLPGGALVWDAILGVGAGMSFVVAIALFALRASTQQGAGALSGMAQTVGYVVAAIGPFVIGFIHDATGNWVAALIVLIACTVGCALIGLLAARPKPIV